MNGITAHAVEMFRQFCSQRDRLERVREKMEQTARLVPAEELAEYVAETEKIEAHYEKKVK